MIRRAVAIACAVLGLSTAAQAADPQVEQAVKSLYRQFVSAQNARDLGAVRAVLLDSPEFIWISDGKPFWGPETLIARMSAYQRAEVWAVAPDYARAKVVEAGPNSAFLYQPLRLTLGEGRSAQH